MTPIINEFVFNHTGSDTNEFVEIMGDPNADLSNYWILQIEGDGNSTTGVIDSAIQLGSTDADGYWTTGFLGNEFENGTTSLLLVEGFTGAEGDDIDLNDDGTIDNALWTTVVDSVAVNDGGATDATYANVTLNSGFDGGAFTVGGASRIPDGTDTDSASDWVRNDFNLSGIDGNNGAVNDGETANTPGTANGEDGGNNGGNNGGGNTDVPFVPVYDIQGAGHTSSFEGQDVRTSGVVTAVDSNGFYIQDVVGDGDIATSDGIFVYTGSNPTVSVGDGVIVTGGVSEYRPGSRANDLTVTQVEADDVQVTASDLPLPSAVILGQGGRVAPTENIEDDAFGSFDPQTDGIDFYESLEGMRVTVQDAHVVGATNQYGETWAVADQGDNATGMHARGGIQLTDGDNNPEKAQIQFDSGILDGFAPGLNMGDDLGDVTGVVDYSFGNFEIKPTETFTVTPGGQTKDVTDLAPTDDQLTIASYNVLNLEADATDGSDDVGSGQFARLAEQIVNNLKTPDILALQEIQDNNGTNTGELSADVTLQALIDAIVEAGGPEYKFVDVDPEFENQQGGQPGGNIRNAYIYNPERVSLVEESLTALTPDVLNGAGVSNPNAFDGSRIPLYAEWEFNGNVVSTINNHFSSKFGSTPVYGDTQPFVDAGRDEREEQATAINEFVKNLQDDDGDANIVVLGDHNDFEFASAQALIENGGDDSQELFDQIKTVDELDGRYTYNFEGNSQVLDHLLVSGNLVDKTEFDIVHVNTDFGDGSAASDHEPILARITLAPAIPDAPDGTQELEFSKLGTFQGEGAEIVAHDPDTQRLFVTNSEENTVDILDITDPENPSMVKQIPLGLTGGPNSVAVFGGLVAVALEDQDKTEKGIVAFFDTDGNLLETVEVGALPDMLTFSPDGTKLVVANEGEADGDVDPEGSISIIDLSEGLDDLDVKHVDFTAFNGREEEYREKGIRLFEGKSLAEDLEPEYIAIAPDGKTAMVTLQEANALALLDLEAGVIQELIPLGLKDYSEDYRLDASDKDDAINLDNYQVFGMYMPDGIAAYETNDQTFYVTANEGDARDEDERIKDLVLDPEAFPNWEYLQQDEVLGRLKASSVDGDTDGDGDIDQLFIYGGRSFSIWDENGDLVFDSGDEIERIVAEQMPELFNANDDEEADSFDSRSDDKGPEPEGVAIGEIEGQKYAFIGLERVGGVMVYNITDPQNAEFVTYVNMRNVGGSEVSGNIQDIAPEGLAFIAAEDSPNGEPMLAIANEESGTTTLWQIDLDDDGNTGEEPAFTLQILHASDLEGGVEAIDSAPNFAAIVDVLEDTYENTLVLSAGDNYLPGPFLNAASDRIFRDEGIFNDVYNELYGLPGDLEDAYAGLHEGGGRLDISIMNVIGFDASALGNHEFDLGTDFLSSVIGEDFRGDGLADDRWIGAQFPYLSANLDFSNDADLSSLYTSDILLNTEFQTGPEQSLAGDGNIPKIAPATIVEQGGEQIGIIGATTPLLASISSPGDTEVVGETSNNMSALAAVLQPVIDQMLNNGINKIMLVSHLQQIALEQELAGLLKGVDVIIAGGSDTILADQEDVDRGLNPGDTPAADYPIHTTNADGDPVVIVSTDGEYSYVGRLVVDFDEDGKIILDENGKATDEDVSGIFATDDETVEELWGEEDAFAEGTKGDLVEDMVEVVSGIVLEQDGNVFGKTDVFLDGRRTEVRTEETNFGNLSADANLAAAQEYDNTVEVSIKNGGGIRAPIGEVDQDGNFLPPQANEEAGKEAGDISQLDIANSLRFNNGLTVLTLTSEQLLQVLEHSVAGVAPGSTPGQFGQFGGISFSFDPSQEVGSRIMSAALIDDDGNPTEALVMDGDVVDAGRNIRIVTLNFLASGGDGYPFQDFIDADPAFANRVDLTDDGLLDDGDATFADAGSEQDALAEYLLDNYSEEAFDEEETDPSEDTRIQNVMYRDDTVLEGLEDEDAILGTDDDDNIQGTRDDDLIKGLDGDDDIKGRRGDDQIEGGEGDDNLRGNFGDDLLNGAEGDDDLHGGFGDDLINGGNGDDHLRGSFGDDMLNGGAGDDLIRGGFGDDMLMGGEGADDLRGSFGDDVLEGGEGDDVLRGGAGEDNFIFNMGDGSDLIRDYQPGIDTITIKGYDATTVEHAIDNAVENGNRLIITLDEVNGDILTFNRTDADDLNEDDFQLIA
ncbi:MAG: choice-of-anchor I family protein [Sneathiella sp.]|nr:choice-of-anchor I family protein [Sneathiella sp.]